MGCNNTKQTSTPSNGKTAGKLNVQGHAEVTETKVTYKILLLGDAGRFKIVSNVYLMNE